jgi:hypothetical protein
MKLSAVLALIATVAATAATTDAHARQSSWLRVEAGAARDNQPRTGATLAVEYGRYVSAAAALSGTVLIRRPAAGAATDIVPAAALGLGVPALRLGVQARAGAVFGAAASAAEPVFATGARLDLGRGFAVRGGLERDRYTATLASLDTLLMATRYEAALDRGGHTGWAVVAAAARQQFGDGNPVHTVYAWSLAPLSASARHRVRFGYAVSWQDAAHSRWVPDDERRGRPAAAPAPPTSPDTIPGRYAPYYSPHDVLAHGLLAEGVVAVGTAWLSANANIGVRATETAPVLQRSAPTPAAPALLFYERSFHPLQLVGAVVLPAGDATSLRIEARHDRTAYYRSSGATVVVTRQRGAR